VVVDGVDDPRQMDALAAMPDLAGGGVLLTGRTGWYRAAGVRVVQIRALRPRAACDLLRLELSNRGLGAVAAATDEELAPVVAATAGHPLAIRLAAGQLRAGGVEAVAAAFRRGRGAPRALYRDLWEPAWQAAATDVRAAVRTVIRLRAAGRSATTATVLAQLGTNEEDGRSALCAAVDAGLLVPRGGAGRRTYRPGLFLGRFLAAKDEER
jgi:hypothetical protein